MIEATNWYLHERTATHADLDDLKAYVLLTAVKNQRKDVVVRLLQQTTMKTDRLDRNRKGGAPSVALSLASLCLKSPPENQGEGTEPDDNRENGLSLWVWAIQCGHLSLVEVLMDEVSITDSMHRIKNKSFPDERTYMPSTYMPTPIQLASRNGHEAIVRALLAKKPDLHNCALEEALAEGHEEVVRMLLGHGTAFGFKNDSKMSSSILKVARWGHENIIRVLLDHGADIESRDFNGGKTPLMEAALRSHEAAVRLLLKKGANPLATDKDGRDTRYWVVHASKFEFATRKWIYPPNDLVDDVYKRACELMHPSLPCPRLTRTRRARLSLYVDAASVKLLLRSHHVCLEIPPASPIEVSSRYNRELNFFKSSSTVTPITLEFSIIHQEDTLDFAIEYAKSLTGVLEVVGGGTRFSSYDTIFQTWTGVELDPHAEFVDQ